MMEDKKAKTSNIQNDKEILNGILTQINSFDSKAGILISVIGIVFGLSLTLLTSFKEYSACEQKLIAFAIIYILFVISSLITITFSVLVIFQEEVKKRKITSTIIWIFVKWNMEISKVIALFFIRMNQSFLIKLRQMPRFVKRSISSLDILF